MLPDLAKNRESVVIEHPKGHHYVRPAAFVLGWQLNYALRHRFYYSVNIKDITEVDFEDERGSGKA